MKQAADSGGRIAVVGPCAAGKTTLAAALQERGWNARQVVQEHSYVPDMWRQINPPDRLIFLNASFETCTERKELSWTEADYQEEQHRLSHARQHCDLYLETDELSQEEVLRRALEFLSGGQPSDETV